MQNIIQRAPGWAVGGESLRLSCWSRSNPLSTRARVLRFFA